MIPPIPNRSVPIGCLAGFFGLILSAFSILAFWGAFKAFGQKPPKTEIAKNLIILGAVTALPALIGVVFSLYRILTAGKRDHYRVGNSLST